MSFQAGQLLTAELLNNILQDCCGYAGVTTAQTTSSTSYVDLATPGPAVTLESSGNFALIIWEMGAFENSTTLRGTYSAIAISGATTQAASDSNSLKLSNNNLGIGDRVACLQYASINPGTNTYTMKYKVSAGGAGNFSLRNLFVFAP